MVNSVLQLEKLEAMRSDLGACNLTLSVVWIHYRFLFINYGSNLLRRSGNATKVDAFPEIPESL